MKAIIIMVVIIMSMGSFSNASYTTYTTTQGYQQPYTTYIPYYHANTVAGNPPSDHQVFVGNPPSDHQVFVGNPPSDNDTHTFIYNNTYNHQHDYDVDYDVDYDLRYNRSQHYLYNTINHRNQYTIYAHSVDIDNNHYYGTYGPHRNTRTYPIASILHNIPAPENCTTKRYNPRRDRYFENLGLRIPSAVSSIQRYRIRWSNGYRSRWYLPGDNDIDNTRRYTDRRMWRYFRHYEHEIVRCEHQVERDYYESNYHYYDMPSYTTYTHPSYAHHYQNTYRNIIDNNVHRSRE